jgi:hypothetical protein
LVESENILQLDALCGFFQSLERYYRTQKLCEGQLVCYALQTTRRTAYSFSEILGTLTYHFRYAHQINHLDTIAYRTVQQLASEFSCRFAPLPSCTRCDTPLFFPPAQVITRRGAAVISTDCYCQKCFSEYPGETYADVAQSLVPAARPLIAVNPGAVSGAVRPAAACH